MACLRCLLTRSFTLLLCILLSIATVVGGNLTVNVSDEVDFPENITNVSNATVVGGNLTVNVSDEVDFPGNVTNVSNATVVGGNLNLTVNVSDEVDFPENITNMSNATVVLGNLTVNVSEEMDLPWNITNASLAAVFPGNFIVPDDLSGDADFPWHVINITGDLIIKSASSVITSGLEHVGGNVIVFDSDVTSLDWLEGLISVGGDLSIKDNQHLTRLPEFSRLQRVGHSMTVTGNHQLKNLSGFDNLVSIGGDFLCEHNPELTVVSGFNQIHRVNGRFSIVFNKILQTIDGWSMLGKVGNRATAEKLGFQIKDNKHLTGLVGFEELDTVKGWFGLCSMPRLMSLPDFKKLRIVKNSLMIAWLGIEELHGFSQLEQIHYELVIQQHERLRSIAGFDSLKSIGTNLQIHENNRLTSVAGFSELKKIGGKFYVGYNMILASFTATPKLQTISGNFLFDTNQKEALPPAPAAAPAPAVQGVRMSTSLEQLQHVGGSFKIVGGCMGQLSSFDSLMRVGGIIEIGDMKCLTSITGFNGLVSHKSDLLIDKNEVLKFLTGFNGLTSVRGDVRISGNSNLTNVTGLTQLANIGGTLNLADNDMLTDISGLDSLSDVTGEVNATSALSSQLGHLKKDCYPWEVPDDSGFHCQKDDNRFRAFMIWVGSLLAVLSMAMSCCHKPWDIESVSQEGDKLVVKTRGRHFLWRKHGASFPINFRDTGISILESESNFLARVRSHSELEVDIGSAMGGLLEEMIDKNFLGTIRLGKLREFKRIWFIMPLIFWMLLGLLCFLTLLLMLKLKIAELLRSGVLTLAAAALVSVPARLWMAINRRLDRKSKAKQALEKELLQRLDAAGWEANSFEREEVCNSLIKQFGWSEEQLETHWNEMLKKQSHEAGVSAAYLLSDEFLELAQTSSGKEDPSFYDLKEAFYLSNQRIGYDVVCPRDGGIGCAFVDVLPRQHRRASTHFLSWTWKYSLSSVRSALQDWLEREGQDPAEVFFYMCFFVNNQYRILADGSSTSNELQDVFEGTLRRAGRMVALLDTWDHPFYLSRIWTVFEQYTAVKIGIPVEVIMSRDAKNSLISEIYKGAEGIRRVKRALSHVDSGTATAWHKQDEETVKALIEATTGFAKVDQKVRRFMTTWVAQQVQDLLLDLVKEDEESP